MMNTLPKSLTIFFLAVSIFISGLNADFVGAQNTALEPVTIQLRRFHQFQFAGYYAAIEKAFYADEGLQVSLREFEPDKDRIAPVLEGKAQYGVGGPALLNLRAQGNPVVVLAQIFQHSPSVLITLRKSGIFSPDELVGKKVMLSQDAMGSAPIQAMLLETLGDLGRITVIPHSYDDVDLINGRVDAMSTYLSNEPFKLKKKGVAVNIMDPHSSGIDFYGDNLFTTEKEIKAHPERVQKMIRATLKGWAYALENKDEIIALIQKKYNPDIDQDQLRYEAKVIDQMILPDLVPIGKINPRRYERIAETYHRLGISTASTVPDGFIYTARPEPAVSLTDEEQAWLAEHPEIVLGIPTTYPPLVIKTSDNTYVGMVVDLFEEISQRLNTRIRLHIEDSWSDIQEKAKNREIDGLALGGKHSSRAALYNATDLLLPTYRSVFARSQNEYQLKKFSDLDGMRIGYKGAGRPTRALLEKLPLAILKPYDDHESMTQALLSREIDVVVAWASYDHWCKQKLQGTIDNIFLINEYPVDFFTHIRKDWPELIPILNKAIAALQQDELPRIINKWFGQWPRASKASSVVLTPEEQAWLNEHPIVRIRFHRQPPYMYLEDGKTAGMAADLLNKISEMVDITFEIEKTPSKWSDDLGRLIRHEDVDMLPSIMATPERESVILFTESYVTSPRFIFTRDNAPFISSIKELSGKSIAVVENYAVHIELVEKHPSVDLLVFNNVAESLRAVSSGKAFAFIGDLFSTPALINKLGLKNLKAACPSGLSDHPLSMGVRNDWLELRDILDKALDAMSTAEKTTIINKWATVKFEHGIRPADVLKWILMVVGAASGILFLFMFWNRSLTKQVKERTGELTRSNESLETEISERKHAQDELRRSRDYLKNLTDSMGDAVFSVKMPERKIEWANESSFNILGYNSEELIGRTSEFLYPHRNEFLAFGDKLTGAVAEGKDVVYVEQFLRKKSGEAFPVELTITIHKERGEVVSVTGIIRDITDRKRAEQKIIDYQQRLKALATQLTIAEEMERRAIAADLHDHVGQSLALARIQLASARKSASDSKLKDKLDDISDTLLKSLEDTQQLMLELSSPAMHETGLSSAISEWLENQIKNRHSLKTEVIDNIPKNLRKTLDPNVRTILFRNVRELIVNAVKHARANKVSVRLEDRNTSIRIIVEDDGIGFDPRAVNEARSQVGGYGLFSIKELMTDLGGSLRIVSEPGKGCTAILSAPFSVDDSRRRA